MESLGNEASVRAVKRTDGLTFDKKGATIDAMKRASKNLVAFGLVLFFALGVFCYTLAAPSQSLASVTGCSQTSRTMAMTGCEFPNYLCGLEPSSLNSKAALSSARSNDLLKNAISLAVGETLVAAPNDGALLDKQRATASPFGPHKVSIRLFNSVLNL